MAALILFGATIGIAAAIGFTWIPMSDALANFLGGVMGAGLGASLAVMGAVYVQRRDRLDRLTPTLNSPRLELREIRGLANRFVLTLKRYPDDLYEEEGLGEFETSVLQEALTLKTRVGELQSYTELPRGVVDWLSMYRRLLQAQMDSIVDDHEWRHDPPEIRFDQTVSAVEKLIADLDKLRDRVESSALR